MAMATSKSNQGGGELISPTIVSSFARGKFCVGVLRNLAFVVVSVTFIVLATITTPTAATIAIEKVPSTSSSAAALLATASSTSPATWHRPSLRLRRTPTSAFFAVNIIRNHRNYRHRCYNCLRLWEQRQQLLHHSALYESPKNGDVNANNNRIRGGGRGGNQKQKRRGRKPNKTTSVISSIAATDREAKNEILRSNSRLSLAPMMDYTDRHFRAMVRLVSSRTLLHTEMVAADDLVGDEDRGGGKTKRRDRRSVASSSPRVQELLGQSATIREGPSVLQLGGNDASKLHTAAKIYHECSSQGKTNSLQYTSLNLNCGCPSPAVSGKKCFGAALMKDPTHVAKLVRAIHDGAEGTMPVSVKCRIGLHDADATPFSRQIYEETKSSQGEFDELRKFVEAVASDGIVTDFQIHARIAVLGGTFSPADNRKIPPLRYDHVRRLAREFPELNFVLNGGIHSLAQAKAELEAAQSEGARLAGVMVGRAFVADPWGFATADEVLYRDAVLDDNQQRPQNRREVLEAYGRHADDEERRADPTEVRRPLVAACAHLFAGEENSRKFRLELDEIVGRPEKLEREAKAQVWSLPGAATTSSSLASAFSVAPSSAAMGGGWDDMQAMDEARPAWDEGQPPLSELIMDAARRHFGEGVLDRSRMDSYDKKISDEEESRRRRATGDPVLSLSAGGSSSIIGDDESEIIEKKVSGGVVDGWFKEGLN